VKLKTDKGDAICQKQDIFKGLMWYAYTDNFANWHVLKIDQVKEIIAQNKQNKNVSSLEDFAVEIVVEVEKDFNNAMGQESLTRFDQPKKSKNRNKNKNKNKITVNQNQNQAEVKPNGGNQKPQNQKGNRPQQNQDQNRNPQQKKAPIIIKKNENKE
jgi:hypothetical protein